MKIDDLIGCVIRMLVALPSRKRFNIQRSECLCFNLANTSDFYTENHFFLFFEIKLTILNIFISL